MEVIEDLLLNGLKIVQDDELYRFTSDSVMLSKFATVKKGDIVADFCSGSGIVGIHLLGINPCIKNVTLFEMQKSLYDLSLKSIVLNGLTEKVFAVNIRLQDIPCEFNEKFSLIVCNPPYMEKGRGLKEEKEEISLCKSEITLTLAEIVERASKCLKFGGRFALVNRADRLCDVICALREWNIEPKRLQLVSGGKKEPYLLMVEGVKGGKKGIKILNTITN